MFATGVANISSSRHQVIGVIGGDGADCVLLEDRASQSLIFTNLTKTFIDLRSVFLYTCTHLVPSSRVETVVEVRRGGRMLTLFTGHTRHQGDQEEGGHQHCLHDQDC